MAEQRQTQNNRQTDDASRLQRSEELLEQEEQVVQSEAAQLQQVLANPATTDPDDIITLQQTVGNRAVSQWLASRPGPADEPVIQPKLRVGAPGDRYEHEADQIAEKVMSSATPVAEQQPAESWPQPVVTAAIQRQETEEQRRWKQQRRTQVGNDYSRQNLERWKRRQQRSKQQQADNSQPKTETTPPATPTLANTNQSITNQSIATGAEQQQLPRKQTQSFEQQAKDPKLQQQNTANELATLKKQDVTPALINNTASLIKQGAESEEKHNLKQRLRDIAGNYYSDRNMKRWQNRNETKTDDQKDEVKPQVNDPQINIVQNDPQNNVVQDDPQINIVKDDIIKDDPQINIDQNVTPETEDEAEFAAMMSVALEGTEQAEEEQEEETAAAESEAAEETAAEAEEEESEAAEEAAEETEAAETAAAEEELAELGMTDWPLSVLLGKPEEPSAVPPIQRQVSPELKEAITAFANPDKYQFDAKNTEKRAATTRIAREEPGIPGLKGVSEDIWLKPLARLAAAHQPAEVGDETGTAPVGSDGSFVVEDAIEQRLWQQKGQGWPLPDEVRTDMEARFGADFSQVQIHTGAEAAQLSEALQAQAFTHGNDIFFNAGKSDFSATEDKKLLAHELTHVIQQMGYGKKDDSGNG